MATLYYTTYSCYTPGNNTIILACIYVCISLSLVDRAAPAGRQQGIVDVLLEHPSISRKHAILQHGQNGERERESHAWGCEEPPASLERFLSAYGREFVRGI